MTVAVFLLLISCGGMPDFHLIVPKDKCEMIGSDVTRIMPYFIDGNIAISGPAWECVDRLDQGVFKKEWCISW